MDEQIVNSNSNSPNMLNKKQSIANNNINANETSQAIKIDTNNKEVKFTLNQSFNSTSSSLNLNEDVANEPSRKNVENINKSPDISPKITNRKEATNVSPSIEQTKQNPGATITSSPLLEITNKKPTNKEDSLNGTMSNTPLSNQLASNSNTNINRVNISGGSSTSSLAEEKKDQDSISLKEKDKLPYNQSSSYLKKLISENSTQNNSHHLRPNRSSLVMTSSMTKEIESIKDLSGSSASSFDFQNDSIELPNTINKQNSTQASVKNLANAIASPVASLKSNSIVEAVSSAANATSEALSNLMSSTEVSNPKTGHSKSQSIAFINNNVNSLSSNDARKSSPPTLKHPSTQPILYQSPHNAPMLDKKNSVNSFSKDKHRKPWYSAFMNSYKQKNEDFKKLFKLPSEEHLLVDYSCALQKEILAHGRLYISLNYVCFRANIIGWETTLIIRLKDIKNIYKDKTAKIIPNAISVLLENEKYFFTSFVSRDKTYTTLFRVWQMALANSTLSHDEINSLLKTFYGEDLGYNSDDAEYEYYKNLRAKSSIIEPSSLDQSKLYNSKNINGDIEVNNSNFENIFGISDSSYSANNHKNNDMNSFSDDQSNKKIKKIIKKIKNDKKSSSSSSNSSISPISPSAYQPGHRQCSSFDAALIDTSESFDNEVLIPVPNTTGVWVKRPRQMVSNHSLSVPSTQSPKKRNSKQKSDSITNGVAKTNDDVNKKLNRLNIELFPQNADNNLAESEINNDNISDSIPQFTVPSSDSSKDTSLSTTTTNAFSTSSPIQNKNDSKESSSYGDIDQNENKEVLDNAKCACPEHQGKEMLNQVYNLSVNYLWECLFGHTVFCSKYWESRKFFNMKIGDWKSIESYPARQLEYQVDLGGAIGRPKNTETQRIIEYKPEVCIVLESESVTHGVPYSDCFTVRNRFCLTRCTSTSTRLSIHAYLNFTQKLNFIAKGFIERNTMGALKDSYNYLAILIKSEFLNSKLDCHEHLCVPTMDAESSIDKSQTQNEDALEYADSDVEDDDDELNELNGKQQRDKTLPGATQPPSLPVHISAILNDTTKNNHSSSAQTFLVNKPSSSYKPATNPSHTNSHIHNHNANESNHHAHHKPQLKHSTSATSKKKHLRHSTSDQHQLLDEVNEIKLGSHSSSQALPTKLVPIQKFSFFKWEINVDTLVRLFIVAMICLMIINGMLYYKLRRIESLADNLRNDPNIMAKMSNTGDTTKDSFNQEIYNWRDLISNTLNAIEKMENSLKVWDKSLESRQNQKFSDEI